MGDERGTDNLRSLLVQCDSLLSLALHRGTDGQWAYDADSLIRTLRRHAQNGSGGGHDGE